MGYDGKGQARINGPEELSQAWHDMGRQPAIAEKMIAFDAEFSVILVRNTKGDVRYWDCSRNRHESGILARCSLPADPDFPGRDGAGRTGSCAGGGIPYRQAGARP